MAVACTYVHEVVERRSVLDAQFLAWCSVAPVADSDVDGVVPDDLTVT